MFNISIDTADLNPEHIQEDLSINDQESIIEFVAEKILGYEDAFKEYDDKDTEDHNKRTNVKIDLSPKYITKELLNHQHLVITCRKFHDYYAFLTKGFKKLEIPPPKV